MARTPAHPLGNLDATACDRRTVLTETFIWHRADQQIRWSRYGSGPPVVFCHGTPWSSALWRPIADALSTTFTVYLWDMLGYGRSSMVDDHDVSLASQGRLLADLLSYWHLEDPHVVAHDYGGAVSLRAHLLHGSRYRSLALVDAVALGPWGSEFFQLVGQHADVFGRLPASLHEALIRAYIQGAAHSALTGQQLDMLADPWTDAKGQAAFYRQIAQADECYTNEIEGLYPSIDIPTTVIWGAEDTWIPVDRAHRLARQIPHSELHVIPRAGHLVQLDTPENLTALLQHWLLTHATETKKKEVDDRNRGT